MKGNGERLRNLMPEEHFPISYSMVSENKLPFPFSKTNQEKIKTEIKKILNERENIITDATEILKKS